MTGAPNRWFILDLADHIKTGPQENIHGIYVPARPIGFYSLIERWKLAYAVFTGKADALFWSEMIR